VLSFWYVDHMPGQQGSASVSARARVRAELTDEIKATARRHVAEAGASSLSLRAVAREMGMASSALYRYFASRDELLTALIVDAYDTVGAAAEEAAATTKGGTVKRFMAVATAIRAWAVANPHDYALLYGSPVPGYLAPQDTVPPAARVSLAALRIVAEGVATGEVDTTAATPTPRAVGADFRRLRDAAGLDIPDDVLSRALLAWTAIFGTVTFELFGHLHRVIESYDDYFDHQIRRAARLIVTGAA
jgi:AcrR family transcriptional regulator